MGRWTQKVNPRHVALLLPERILLPNKCERQPVSELGVVSESHNTDTTAVSTQYLCTLITQPLQRTRLAGNRLQWQRQAS
jgi:hypothetical protein